jgi:hypothetical protein
MPESSNELLKKLSQVKKELIQPVLGDATIEPSQIVDFTVMKSYSGRSKVGIIFMDGDGLKEVFIGAVHVNKLEECIRKNKTITIKRNMKNGVPQTEVIC